MPCALVHQVHLGKQSTKVRQRADMGVPAAVGGMQPASRCWARWCPLGWSVCWCAGQYSPPVLLPAVVPPLLPLRRLCAAGPIIRSSR